ncbi:hypothetical protein PR202_ga07471 [Eleusine coracana subsp. coracana]|uniref:Uncharacterized protein n=1 Tax=Eleusine coracana subsp. coracana TaxID=191504 RepID=A0AAV5BXR6_ELECO|nr:hypothetical protein PR202_ga07471 [Eleusine coracana subsp. coracana]
MSGCIGGVEVDTAIGTLATTLRLAGGVAGRVRPLLYVLPNRVVGSEELMAAIPALLGVVGALVGEEGAVAVVAALSLNFSCEGGVVVAIGGEVINACNAGIGELSATTTRLSPVIIAVGEGEANVSEAGIRELSVVVASGDEVVSAQFSTRELSATTMCMSPVVADSEGEANVSEAGIGEHPVVDASGDGAVLVGFRTGGARGHHRVRVN